MRRIFILLFVIGFLLVACGTKNESVNESSNNGANNNSNSSEGTEDIVNKGNSDHSAETTDWEPTIYETVNTFDGVTMSVKEGTISSTGLTVIFENNSDKQGVYGMDFLLEKKIKSRWYQVPVIIDGNYAFTMIGYNLGPSDVKEWTVDWDKLYGSLNPGEYRIVKGVLDFRKTGDFDEHFLTAEFTID